MFALVDVNNFYASCEQLWEPKRRNRPVVVLSNNDGCVVARSKEAKAIGVPMGAPWFKLREMAKHHRIIALSSNYELYASMSNQVVEVLRDFPLSRGLTLKRSLGLSLLRPARLMIASALTC